MRRPEGAISTSGGTVVNHALTGSEDRWTDSRDTSGHATRRVLERLGFENAPKEVPIQRRSLRRALSDVLSGLALADRHRFGEDSQMTDHAVLVHITSLQDDDTGLDEIEDPLIEAIEAAGVGEFDGNDIGADGAVLYMYGPDADRLWDAVETIVRAAGFGSGSYAVKRYGEPGATEVRIELS